MRRMIEGKLALPIEHLKPKIEALESIETATVSLSTIAMAKADGEFTLFKYEQGESFTVNRYGHYRKDFPALNEATKALKKAGIQSAEILCELYAVDDKGRPVILPEFIKMAKGKQKKLGNLHLGIFDLVAVNGAECFQDYEWKLLELDSWFEGCQLVYTLPWTRAVTREVLISFWRKAVEELGYEGLVLRTDREVVKVKPSMDVDAVIIAINKVDSTGKPVKRYPEEAVSSIRVALMDKLGRLLVLGDCTVADRGVQKALWKLHDIKVEEDSERVYVHPCAVIQIRFTSMFHGSICEILKYDGKYQQAGELKFWKMRNPRFMRFRTDKEAVYRDIRLDQVKVGDNDSQS